MADFIFETKFAHSIPDPNFQNAERHIFMVPAKDMPEGIPRDPNARKTNTNKKVYRQVEDSLLNEGDEGEEAFAFHLKNKGITIIAESVEKIGDDKYKASLRKDNKHGIVDGAHTYRIIMNNQKDIKPEDNKEQYVKVEILTSIKDRFITGISRGLNTSVQVQAMSLDDLAGHFDWLKDLLRYEPYIKNIRWRENDKGVVDARDLICILTLFNVRDFAVGDSKKDPRHPIHAYTSAAKCLDYFEEDREVYKNLSPIIKDILMLHDEISGSSRDIWNEKCGGRGAILSFVEEVKRAPLLVFKNTKVDPDARNNYRLYKAVLYPILAGFRIYVEQDPLGDGTFRWRAGYDLKKLKEVWYKLAPRILNGTQAAALSNDRKIQTVGRSSIYWRSMLDILLQHDLAEFKERILRAKNE